MLHRRATHCGKWYSASSTELSTSLQQWLDEAEVVHSPARAILAPHASYQFSGPCAAHAYKQIEPSVVKRVFIFGPSHHKWFKKCALTTTQACQTPLYDLLVDTQVNADLVSTGMFEWMDIQVDEAEHSIEMQLPYIAQIMKEYSNTFAVIPILVGTLTSEQIESYAGIFWKYFANPENLFIISSDFCHWGKKFNYTPYNKYFGKPIYKFIEDLDKKGMDAIEKLDANAFCAYLNNHKNTICGRNPILILLRMVNKLYGCDYNASLKFIKYCQSNKCASENDSSVSYASASLVVERK